MAARRIGEQYPAAKRRAALATAKTEGVAAAAKQHKVTEGTIYRWRHQAAAARNGKPPAPAPAPAAAPAPDRARQLGAVGLAEVEAQLEQALAGVRTLRLALRNVFGDA